MDSHSKLRASLPTFGEMMRDQLKEHFDTQAQEIGDSFYSEIRKSALACRPLVEATGDKSPSWSWQVLSDLQSLSIEILKRGGGASWRSGQAGALGGISYHFLAFVERFCLSLEESNTSINTPQTETRALESVDDLVSQKVSLYQISQMLGIPMEKIAAMSPEERAAHKTIEVTVATGSNRPSQRPLTGCLADWLAEMATELAAEQKQASDSRMLPKIVSPSEGGYPSMAAHISELPQRITPKPQPQPAAT